MDIQLVGTITNILPPVSGTSAKGEWVRQEFILSVENEQYPRSVCFQIFGKDRIDEAALQLNERVRVHLDINANEYNGKFYNTINCWKVDRNNQQNVQGNPVYYPNQPVTPPANPTSAPSPQSASQPNPDDDDLPF